MIHGHHFHFIDEPALNAAHTSSHTDRTITVQTMSDVSMLADYTMERPWIPLSGQEGRYFSKIPFEEADKDFSWGLEIKEVLTLIWDPNTQTILYVQGEHYTAQRLRFWIYHTFFPLVLELARTYHFLHVGAVEVKGKTLFFSAPSFGGKSTLTDYFIQQGATLISDDALGIEEKNTSYVAIPAYPYHRPYREPEELGYKAEKFASVPNPIAAVFLLQKGEAHENVRIEEVKGIEKFKAFHHSVFIEFPFRKKERFGFFGKMAQTVPVYSITIPWDLERLEEVYTAMTDFIC